MIEPSTAAAGLLPQASTTSARSTRAERYGNLYEELLGSFSGQAVDVSFRQLVGPLPASELTHGMYPYPARLVRHIPRYLLNVPQLNVGVETIVDPFCGSGTVLLEAQLAGVTAHGIDTNPVAALVSRVKTSPRPLVPIVAGLEVLRQRFRRSRSRSIPAAFLHRWYSEQTLKEMARLASVVLQYDGSDRDVFLVALALTARATSLSDPRLPVPVRASRPRSPRSPWDEFEMQLSRVASGVSSLSPTLPTSTVTCGDSRDSSCWPQSSGTRSAVLTSPPYAAAQKYARSTSIESAWLGYTDGRGSISIERQTIGREHLRKSEHLDKFDAIWDGHLRTVLVGIHKDDGVRASILARYFLDMQEAFRVATEQRPERMVVISGTNHVAGRLINTHMYLGNLLEHLGWSRTLGLRDTIRGRTLLTRRKTDAAPARYEHVDIYETDDA